MEYLDVQPGKVYFDGTMGGAGHSGMILESLESKGHLYSFDQDEAVIARHADKVKAKSNWTSVHSNFAHIARYCNDNDITIDGGILLDLGLSSIQLDDPERGFGFQNESELDMRMDQSKAVSAFEVVNRFSEKDLADILYNYGDERFSRQIAARVIKNRPVETTKELADIIKGMYASKSKATFKVHPATRSFQALRVYVNNEMYVLVHFLASCLRGMGVETEEIVEAFDNLLWDKKLRREFIDEMKEVKPFLEPSARIVVLSFQSQEDRIVKRFFRDASKKGLKALQRLELLTKKPVGPQEDEVAENPRSRSTKLRAAKVGLAKFNKIG